MNSVCLAKEMAEPDLRIDGLRPKLCSSSSPDIPNFGQEYRQWRCDCFSESLMDATLCELRHEITKKSLGKTDRMREKLLSACRLKVCRNEYEKPVPAAAGSPRVTRRRPPDIRSSDGCFAGRRTVPSDCVTAVVCVKSSSLMSVRTLFFVNLHSAEPHRRFCRKRR